MIRSRRHTVTVAAVVFVAIAALGWGVGCAPMAAPAAAPPTPEGWQLVWSDDFDGAAGTLPSSDDWIFDTGTSYPGGPASWGTGEIQTYTTDPANVSRDGSGNLRITPLRDASGGWTSARIETRRSDFKPPAGGVLRIEARLQMPDVTGEAALGYWPAFWALGSPYRGNYWNWPAIGELDVMENVNGIDAVWGVLHCGTAPGGPCNEFDGLGASRPCPGASCQSAFHTYRFEWDRSVTPNAFRWYVDGEQFHRVDQDRVDAATWNDMTSHAGYFLLLNVAMGGSFPDGAAGHATPTAATVSGQPMLVDYVAVWTRGGSTTTTSQPTTSQPTTTTTSPPGGGGRDAYATIEAESFDAQSGVQVEPTSDTGGGQDVGWIADGDWIRFDDVDFGSSPPVDVVARVASGAAAGVSGLVEVRIDSPTAPPIGSFAVAGTGGWQAWRTVPGNVAAVTGRHTVFLTFTSGQPADFVNVNWFHFRR